MGGSLCGRPAHLTAAYANPFATASSGRGPISLTQTVFSAHLALSEFTGLPAYWGIGQNGRGNLALFSREASILACVRLACNNPDILHLQNRAVFHLPRDCYDTYFPFSHLPQPWH